MYLRTIYQLFLLALLLTGALVHAQNQDKILEGIVKEATENSQLEKLAHELMVGFGLRF